MKLASQLFFLMVEGYSTHTMTTVYLSTFILMEYTLGSDYYSDKVREIHYRKK